MQFPGLQHIGQSDPSPAPSIHEWNDQFLKRMKCFITWYAWLFIGFILMSLPISVPDAPSAIYLLLFASLLAAGILIFIPLRWFEKTIPFSIPAYLIFIHIFLSSTGGGKSPYYLMYLMPLILASILYRYTGAVITLLLILASHLILEQLSFSTLIPYLASKHFLARDLPIFIIVSLIGVKTSVIATMLVENRDAIDNLVGQIAKAKEEWETSFNAIDDMIILDRDYNIVRANTAAAKRFKVFPYFPVLSRYHG
ncbi:MAG: hypothetical protein HY266_08535 [Deltaproteobacteria bacterium]|nr:hypothetical protein [Deltaproteobacteria bacterium]